jgi:hypothetical protein
MEERRESELSTADLAGVQPVRGEEPDVTPDEVPEPVPGEDRLPPDGARDERSGQEERMLDKAPPAPPMDETEGVTEPLFPLQAVQDYRARWQSIQVRFVDQPKDSVQQADGLVAEVVRELAEGFSSARAGLESQWDRGEDVSTEDLRQALRRYRSFFERLLAA